MNSSVQYARSLSRRGFLHVGTCTALGLSLGDYFRLKAQADIKNYTSTEGKAKSIIHIFLPGGMAHQESFDPKGFAPPEYKGPYNPINTKVDGLQFGELWKNTAQVADKMVVIRSMTHGEAAHERGTHNMFTGYRPSPALQYPSIGSVISHEFGTRNNLPPYVCIPNQPNEFAGSGYLSSAYGPFSLGADPANGKFKVQDLALPGGISEGRFNRRRSLLDGIDNHFKTVEKSDAVNAMDTFYQDAYKLISSPQAREAFALDKEADKLKDEYGRNDAGMRLLMARRLVEAGVRFVSVTYGGWDHHDNIHGAMGGQVPKFDQAYARLINDLSERGLLESTLVMVSSEFGRTRPLAESIQRRPRRRRPQTRPRLRHLRRPRCRAGKRSDDRREPRDDGLQSAWHQWRQGTHGTGSTADRDRGWRVRRERPHRLEGVVWSFFKRGTSPRPQP
jgi:hypothetical protein